MFRRCLLDLKERKLTFLVFTLKKLNVFSLSDLKLPTALPFFQHISTLPSDQMPFA